MPARRIATPDGVPRPIAEGLARLEAQLHIPAAFGEAVLAEATQVAAAPLPAARADMTDIEFITIDPEGSMDLDQAMCITRAGNGYRVFYAIAEVAAWVRPDGEIDQEAHRRGQTMYAPHRRTPLHPPQLSEQAASLLADGKARPAHVWTIDLDRKGTTTAATVKRAMVRSRRRMSYVEVQQLLDAGQGFETILLLKEVGELREAQEQARGGVSLPIPEQEVHADGDVWTLSYRAPLAAENWNAQISLMTGMAAAEIMMRHKVGVLRTLPPADAQMLGRLQRTARAFKISWPTAMGYAEFLRTLDVTEPRHMAMLQQCTTLFRGASYVAFNGALPETDLKHNALAAFYTHTTAPLRRLVDRYVLEVCSCLEAGEPVPAWVLAKLDGLPLEMRESDRRAKAFERGVVDLVETLILAGKQGTCFQGTIIDEPEPRHNRPGRIMISDPAVEADILGAVKLGDEVTATLKSTDLVAGKAVFQLVEQHNA